MTAQRHWRERTLAIRATALALLTGAASGYEAPTPRYLTADLVWRDAKTGKERADQGQLWFRDLPAVDDNGEPVAFGRPGHLNGIKWFVPKTPGDIRLVRSANARNPRAFVLQDYYGERPLNLAFESIDVVLAQETLQERFFDQRVDEVVDFGKRAPASEIPGEGAAGDLLDAEPNPAPVPTKGTGRPSAGAGAAKGTGSGEPSPLRFAVPAEIGTRRIPVSDLVKITFLEASDGLKREVYGGRYVQFSNQASGDEGRVQIAAATFFGGPAGDERFTCADFLTDGSILLSGSFYDLAFVDSRPIRVLGTDPAADAYPSVEREDPRRNRRWTEYPRRTPAFVRYRADLTRIEEVVRLPWGSGTGGRFVRGPDGAIYLPAQAGPHLDAFAAGIRRATVIENTEAETQAKARNREPGPDSFVVKLAPDLRTADWIVRVRHSGADIFLRPDGRLLVRRGNDLFFITADGAVEQGPALEIAGSHMAVDPRTGALYFGGSYRSGTGLEPYVCPYLYKVDAAGKPVWTGYGWTGPIVGVEQHRLVADSSVTRVRVGEDGSLTLTGWSDGGNTVLSWQPYDMRRPAPCSGFASSVWGATGGLTVRIAHIIHMDAETLEVDHCTMYVGYLPTSDIPTLINIYDMCPTANGDVALTGGGWTGFVETQDAWLTSWWRERRTNEFALAKGGPFFTLFRPDFSRPRMSTITPGASGLQAASRGKWVLLYGGATDLKPTDVDRPYARRFPTFIRHAVQPRNGGGLDGYALLVDTDGPPQPSAQAEAAGSGQTGRPKRRSER